MAYRSHARPPRRHPGQSRASHSTTALLRRSDWRPVIDFVVLLILLAACALGGGSAFADTMSLLYVRPMAVVATVIFLLTPARFEWQMVRIPVLLLAALALLMMMQLVPLPPAAWLALPGRAPYAEAAAAAGLAQPWRPLSITPDLTMNSLAALVIPAAVLIGFAKIDEKQRRWLVTGLVILCCASAALGIAQFAGGEGSALYLYKRTYPGFPVGLLANRNHQAALLALTFPALRLWTLGPTSNQNMARRRSWLALALGVLIVPVILATGSRAGMAVALASIVATALAFPPAKSAGAAAARYALLIRFGVPALLVSVVLVSYLLGRAVSFDRLSSISSVEADQRFQFAPVVLRIIEATFPAGTGFGSFDPVFRQYEPDSTLIAGFFNHAHNELLELTMTAGGAGLLLLAAFLLWWGACLWGALRPSTRMEPARDLVMLGAMVVAILLTASLVDYPLRSPLLLAVFALACGWLSARQSNRAEQTLQANRVAIPRELG